jgi:hypothetical protein
MEPIVQEALLELRDQAGDANMSSPDQGKRGAITVLSEYRQQRSRKDGHKLVTTKSGRLFNLPQVVARNGEPWRARTSDPLIKSQLLYQLS